MSACMRAGRRSGCYRPSFDGIVGTCRSRTPAHRNSARRRTTVPSCTSTRTGDRQASRPPSASSSSSSCGATLSGARGHGASIACGIRWICSSRLRDAGQVAGTPAPFLSRVEGSTARQGVCSGVSSPVLHLYAPDCGCFHRHHIEVARGHSYASNGALSMRITNAACMKIRHFTIPQAFRWLGSAQSFEAFPEAQRRACETETRGLFCIRDNPARCRRFRLLRQPAPRRSTEKNQGGSCAAFPG